MTAAQSCSALPAHGVDFIDKYDAGSIVLGLVEKVSNPGGTDAYKHLDEL